jgi:RNA polymerase sigma-70 factor (ECF subfamily)
MASPEDREVTFRNIYQAHFRAVAAYTARRLSSQDAEDALAETFLVAWRRLEDIPTGGLTLPWLYGVARRVVSQGRRSGRRRDRLFALLSRVERSGLVSEPEAALAGDPAVDLALAGLRPKDRELLRLSEWDLVSHADLARIFSCSTNAISIRLHRAHRRFAEALRSVEEQSESARQREASA